MSEAPQQQFQGSNGRSNEQDVKLDSQFDRIEASFEAIASQHKLPHRRLLALDKIASYHGVPKGTFRRAFQLWLESNSEGGQR